MSEEEIHLCMRVDMRKKLAHSINFSIPKERRLRKNPENVYVILILDESSRRPTSVGRRI